MEFDELAALYHLTTPAHYDACRRIWIYGKNCGAASRSDMPLPPPPDIPELDDLPFGARAVLFAELSAHGFHYPDPIPQRYPDPGAALPPPSVRERELAGVC